MCSPSFLDSIYIHGGEVCGKLEKYDEAIQYFDRAGAIGTPFYDELYCKSVNPFLWDSPALLLPLLFAGGQLPPLSEQVANHLNVNVQTVSRWECGTTLPDVLTLPVLARLYGVTVDDFYKKSAVAYNSNVLFCE